MSWFNPGTWLAPQRSPSRIHLFTFSWNEERMLPFFFRHYDPIVERYVFYDDSSSDATLEILSRHPKVEVRRFERSTPGSYVASARTLQNAMWKESRGICDWVIVTAVDEHLQHPDFGGYLAFAKRKGITAIPALGYEMLSTDFPAPHLHLATAITWGAPSDKMSKLSLFDPDAIRKTSFKPGRHEAAPEGDVRYPARDELLNLHFKWMSYGYAHARYAFLRLGLGDVDRAKKWGREYDFPETELRALMEGLDAAALDISAPGLDHHVTHAGKRWWRSGADRPKQPAVILR